MLIDVNVENVSSFRYDLNRLIRLTDGYRQDLEPLTLAPLAGLFLCPPAYKSENMFAAVASFMANVHAVRLIHPNLPEEKRASKKIVEWIGGSSIYHVMFYGNLMDTDKARSSDQVAGLDPDFLKVIMKWNAILNVTSTVGSNNRMSMEHRLGEADERRMFIRFLDTCVTISGFDGSPFQLAENCANRIQLIEDAEALHEAIVGIVIP
jgi:hypothetical protein